PESGDEEHDGSEDVVESRYDIDSRRQPPKTKRRRTGTRADEGVVPTVYTTDEDEPYEDMYSLAHQSAADDGISEEEREYDLSASESGGSRSNAAETVSRRAYCEG
ncbi:hypothetical protein PYCCODRAFT_1462667, partial [Trametes coccinea BRFM310]